MNIQTNEQKYIVITTSKLARHLIKLGFIVVDIKPHKSEENRTVFVFREERNIREIIKEQLQKNIVLS